MSCVGDNTLAHFVEGRLAADAVASVEDHLAGCPSCRAVVSELGRSSVVPGHAAPAANDALFADGTVLADRYQVVRFIAAGGMGEVYEALDRELGARIALKTMRPELAADAGAVDRFKREIHLARRVTHPNVCRLFDFVVHVREGGARVPFLTMEFLEGETLDHYLSRVGCLSPSEALPLVDQLTGALEAAHQSGVVHRDFKCHNIVLIGARGPASGAGKLRAVVTDFGVARASDGQDLVATRTGARGLIGSPAYMAPEQVEGREAGPEADIYALGVVLFRMVTGALPFEEETALLTAVRRLEHPAPSPRSRVADLDEVWDQVISRCLQRQPSARFAHAREVFEALGGQTARTSGAHTIPPTWHPRPLPVVPAKRTRWPIFVAGALAIGATAGALLFWPRPQPKHAAATDGARLYAATAPAPAAPLAQSVVIRSDPPGALVVVDSNPVATTPAVVPLVLPHEVTLTLDGYSPAREVVTGSEINVHLTRPRPAAHKPTAPKPAKLLLDE